MSDFLICSGCHQTAPNPSCHLCRGVRMYHSTYEYSKNAGKILKPAEPIQPGKLHAHDDPVPLGDVNTGPFTRGILRLIPWAVSFWCMFKMVHAFDKDETAWYFLWFGCMLVTQDIHERIRAYQHRYVTCPHCARAFEAKQA